MRTDIATIPTLAIYTPMSISVADSTRPLFEHQYPEETTSHELDESVEIVRALAPERLVLSRDERLHWNFF